MVGNISDLPVRRKFPLHSVPLPGLMISDAGNGIPTTAKVAGELADCITRAAFARRAQAITPERAIRDAMAAHNTHRIRSEV